MEATMSENCFGFMRANSVTYRALSTWNRPSMLPPHINSNDFGSSSGMSSGFISIPKRSLMLLQAPVITPKVRRPRKSIFKRPRSGV